MIHPDFIYNGIMLIRNAMLSDLEVLSEIEHRCFLSSEACDRRKMKGRIKAYPDLFFVLEDDGKIVAFINGFATDEENLKDIMYYSPSMHDEKGKWQMIFSLACLPSYRHRGYATMLMNHMIDITRKKGRKGIVLTCKKKMILFYEKFGYHNEGISLSTHGDVKWYQMRLTFGKE